MTIRKSQLYILMLTLAALAKVVGAGRTEDALLSLAAMTMGVSLILHLQIPQRSRWVVLAFIALFMIYFALTLQAPSSTGIVNVVGIGISGIVFLFFLQNAQLLMLVPRTTSILLGSAALILLVGLGSDMVEKNTISGISAYFVIAAGVSALAKGAPLIRTTLLVCVLVSMIGLVLGHRLMMGAGGVLLITVLALHLVPLEAFRALIIVALIGTIVLFVALFSGMWGLSIRNFDAYFIEYTGRTVLSGRQIIWPVIISATSQSSWFGLGTGATFSDLYDSLWSGHSYFLQIYMQSGLVGLGALGAVLLSLWAAIGRPRRSQPVSIYMTGCFVMVLIHMSFEVFLMQVNLLMGCVVWMLLGLGVGLSRGMQVQALYFQNSSTPSQAQISRHPAKKVSARPDQNIRA
jgi:hypothetical protein